MAREDLVFSPVLLVSQKAARSGRLFFGVPISIKIPKAGETEKQKTPRITRNQKRHGFHGFKIYKKTGSSEISGIRGLCYAAAASPRPKKRHELLELKQI
jgi:hypothetical protein